MEGCGDLLEMGGGAGKPAADALLPAGDATGRFDMRQQTER